MVVIAIVVVTLDTGGGGGVTVVVLQYTGGGGFSCGVTLYTGCGGGVTVVGTLRRWWWWQLWCYTRHRWWSVGASELVAVADRRRASTEQKLLRLTGKGFYLVTSGTPYGDVFW